MCVVCCCYVVIAVDLMLACWFCIVFDVVGGGWLRY